MGFPAWGGLREAAAGFEFTLKDAFSPYIGCFVSDRLIAIGDIHGCKIALEKLLEIVAPEKNDVVVTLGDYVDRGPDSRGVVDVLIEWKKKTRLVCLMGNHEEMMLEVINNGGSHLEWLKHGGVDTLDSYGFDGDLDFLPADHQDFFESLGDFFEYEDFFFTHAAYDPEIELEDQPVDLLRWYHLTQGLPSRHKSGRTAIVGHTANKEGEVLDAGHLICLDTYCYGGGWLTAMDLASKQTWQTNQIGEVRE